MSVSSSDNNDMLAIAMGGGGFAQRMEQFAAAKKAHDDAYAALQIGADARAEYDKAVDLKAKAEKALAEARDAAKSFVDKAQTEADNLLADANDRRIALVKEAADLKAMADAARGEAAAAHAEAVSVLAAAKSDIAGRLKAVEQAEASVAKKLAEIDKAKSGHDAAKQKFEDLIANIRALTAEI